MFKRNNSFHWDLAVKQGSNTIAPDEQGRFTNLGEGDYELIVSSAIGNLGHIGCDDNEFCCTNSARNNAAIHRKAKTVTHPFKIIVQDNKHVLEVSEDDLEHDSPRGMELLLVGTPLGGMTIGTANLHVVQLTGTLENDSLSINLATILQTTVVKANGKRSEPVVVGIESDTAFSKMLVSIHQDLGLTITNFHDLPQDFSPEFHLPKGKAFLSDVRFVDSDEKGLVYPRGVIITGDSLRKLKAIPIATHAMKVINVRKFLGRLIDFKTVSIATREVGPVNRLSQRNNNTTHAVIFNLSSNGKPQEKKKFEESQIA